MTIAQRTKQKKTKKTKSSPTEEVQKWVKEFVEVPHPVFADFPPCPFAKKARLENKTEFREVSDMEPDSNIWIYIEKFDFDKKDILILIFDPKRWKPHYTKKLVEQLNEAFKKKDIAVIEDHPKLITRVKDVVLNQGKYILLFFQNRKKLQKFEKQLRKTDYYKHWGSKYDEELKKSVYKV